MGRGGSPHPQTPRNNFHEARIRSPLPGGVAGWVSGEPFTSRTGVGLLTLSLILSLPTILPTYPHYTQWKMAPNACVRLKGWAWLDGEVLPG